MAAPLRVNFVLHAAGKTGGVLVVLEYARRLRAAGHDVRVYHPALPYSVYYEALPAWKRPLARALAAWRTIRGAARARRDAGDAGMRLVPCITGAFVRDADATIATAWPTAYDVAALGPSKGRKLYFIQHYETWNGRVEAVDGSYRLPLDLLTIAPWLTALMREKFGREVAAELHNGIDLDRFSPPAARPEDPLTILMLHHVLEVKGVPDGLEVLRRIHERHPAIRIRTFGMFPFPDAPSYVEHFRDPPPEMLVRLYRESDVYLSPSLAEGWHLPPMEAMACGCALVATRVGCIPVLDEGDNMVTASPGDRDGLFAGLDALAREPARLREVARKGRATILRYGWDEKAAAFEGTLLALTGR